MDIVSGNKITDAGKVDLEKSFIYMKSSANTVEEFDIVNDAQPSPTFPAMVETATTFISDSVSNSLDWRLYWRFYRNIVAIGEIT
jgi:hypothetical protein